MNSSCTIGVHRCRVQSFRPSGLPISPAWWITAALVLLPPGLLAQGTNGVAGPSPIPDVGFSVLRLLGALVFVLGLFLGGVWLIRRWQQNVAVRRGGPRLVVLDVQSLGGRQSLYVVGYERQRLLIGSSATGVSLITHLPDGPEGEPAGPSGPASFAAAFQQVLGRKGGG